MEVLYNLFIQPIVLIYDILFTLIYKIIEEPALAVLGLSVVVNFIVLPLYKKAEILQKAEQEKIKRMQPYLDHIRKNFSGDERFMMQSTYYRIEHYNPINALKEAGPLFLQIPFFMAAYSYISGITILNGASFGFIKDLSRPDELINIAGFSINILPIFMTAVNIVSGMIYSKGGPIRQKIQIYGTALIFLILLYSSPSGLVLYWTMNNLFSLGREIYYVVKPSCKKTTPVCDEDDISEHGILETLLPELALSVLLGFYIPCTVIASSPIEFTVTDQFQSELLYYPTLVFTGLFLVWSNVIISFIDKKKRDIFNILLWCALSVAITNQFTPFFQIDTGALYADLSFDKEIILNPWITVINILCCLLICAALTYLYMKKKTLLIKIGTVILLSIIGISFDSYRPIAQYISTKNNTTKNADNGVWNTPITLTRTGKNVVVMMLDRAIGG
ncbi:membrane protein insertase YidC, partial [bacterium]|nr:membrane protein insertase YidC [bacterium]